MSNKPDDIKHNTRKLVDQRKLWLALARGLKFTASQIEAAIKDED